MTLISDKVIVADGPIRGIVENGIISFKGVPFAAPPTGPLRWRAPQRVKPWTDVRNATEFAPDCWQLPFEYDVAPPRTRTSEDCLYLNVWRPADDLTSLPVLVWIYGGGWVIGASSAAIYDGARLAKRGIVVVSLNYRIGRFGFFAHPKLTEENADDGLFFNYGILDQIAALKWIRANITGLGGDPGKITVMGESAGGVSVHALITSPMNDGLFHKAIIMSGGDGGNLGTATLADGEELGINFGRRRGVEPDDPDAVAKLRALTPNALADGLTFGAPRHDPPTFNYGGPIEDGRIVAKIGDAYASGAFQRVPMMIGATSADMDGRTGFMIGGARRISKQLAKAGIPVFHYRFSYVASTSKATEALHASDLPFFFDTQRSAFGAQTSPTDNEMGRTISDYVVAFAKADAREPYLPGWPRFTGDTRIMDFSRAGLAEMIEDPWATEIDAAPPPLYPGLNVGGARKGAPPTGHVSSNRPPLEASE
jgi:para-nitrobenzyl esterase